MPNPFIDLAASKNFRISHEYETVWLFRDSHSKVVIGDFYGDPSVAIIDAEERWCAVGGYGVIVYFLDAPFKPYEYDICSSQYLEAGRTKQDQWWVESIEQTGPFSICVKCENGIQHNLQLHRMLSSNAQLID